MINCDNSLKTPKHELESIPEFELLQSLLLDTLTMTRIDSKCGEWGGDQDKIIVYTDKSSKKLFTEYKRIIKDCRTDKNNIIIQTKCKLTKDDKELIYKSLEELLHFKLNSYNIPINRKIVNYVKLNNGTFSIVDSSDKEWTKFKEFLIKIKNCD